MKRKIGLYDPYLDTLGGGEKHILSILKALEDDGCEISVFWDSDLNQEISKRLNIKFKNIEFLENIFVRDNAWSKIKKLKKFDIFFYVTDGSYFFSTARKNFVFCMVPKKDLYNMSFVNRLKLWNFKAISNSLFTKKLLEKWGLKSDLIYPFIDEEFVNLKTNDLPKENMILSVGRFFGHLHSKKHGTMIDFFRKLKKENKELKDFKLILAGGLKKEDEDYFNQLKDQCRNDDSIVFKTNATFNEIFSLYKKSLLYWHFAGYGEDEEKNSELVEHLGITPLEAMSAGCITFCFKAGGPRELIEDGENGFLFENYEDIKLKMEKAIYDKKLQERIKENAKRFIVKNFKYEVFRERVRKIIIGNW